MTTIYCGIGPPPKHSRRGTMKECLDSGRVSYWGVEKIDPKLLDDKLAKLGKLEKKIRAEKDPTERKLLMIVKKKLKKKIKETKRSPPPPVKKKSDDKPMKTETKKKKSAVIIPKQLRKSLSDVETKINTSSFDEITKDFVKNEMTKIKKILMT